MHFQCLKWRYYHHTECARLAWLHERAGRKRDLSSVDAIGWQDGAGLLGMICMCLCRAAQSHVLSY